MREFIPKFLYIHQDPICLHTQVQSKQLYKSSSLSEFIILVVMYNNEGINNFVNDLDQFVLKFLSPKIQSYLTKFKWLFVEIWAQYKTRARLEKSIKLLQYKL